VALAGELYRDLTNSLKEDPGDPGIWEGSLEANRLARAGAFGTAPLMIGDDEDRLRFSMEQRFGSFVDLALSRRGLNVDGESRGRLLKHMASALDMAVERLLQVAEGDYSPDKNAQRFPEWPSAPEAAATSMSITGLPSGYLGELRAAGKTMIAAEKSWRPVFTGFAAFLGYDDASRVTMADMVAWKEKRLKEVSAKTVRDTDFAGLRAVFAWAAENGKIAASPVRDVKVRSAKKTRSREKGFTREEAEAILRAALAYRPGAREGAVMAAAKRWTPWLCAYTGARISEMTQLRKEDVLSEDGIPYLRITPEAGSVKSGVYRDVPLHPHLVELAFLQFVAASPSGPLFYSTRQRRGGTTPPAQTVSGRVGGWIRSLRLVSDEVQPNHGWRHRFKTVGREVGIDGRIMDAIQGHAPRSAGDDYGDVTLRAKERELLKLPGYGM
jgi:integrase